jgi:hypothetical protein
MNVSGTLPWLVDVGPDVALSDVRTVLPYTRSAAARWARLRATPGTGQRNAELSSSRCSREASERPGGAMPAPPPRRPLNYKPRLAPPTPAPRMARRAREVGQRARMSSGPLIVVAVLLVLTFVVTVVIARSELARSGAKFLQQCRHAGFDAAECRLIEATTHT